MTGKLDSKVHVEVTSREAWRAWLEANFTSGDGIWLVTYKKHCGDRHVPWPDVVREALCFGWIDSKTRRVDEDRMKVYVSPRKVGSIWSATNKRHVVSLIEAGLMTPAGMVKIERAKADGSWTFLDDVEALVPPEDLLAEFAKASPKARENYEAFPNSAKKRLLYWIKTAKRRKTRQDRIAKLVAAAYENQVAGQPAPKA